MWLHTPFDTDVFLRDGFIKRSSLPIELGLTSGNISTLILLRNFKLLAFKVRFRVTEIASPRYMGTEIASTRYMGFRRCIYLRPLNMQFLYADVTKLCISSTCLHTSSFD